MQSCTSYPRYQGRSEVYRGFNTNLYITCILRGHGLLNSACVSQAGRLKRHWGLEAPGMRARSLLFNAWPVQLLPNVQFQGPGDY